MEKSKRIKREENRLKKIFTGVEENKKRTVEGLIKRAAFMRASLEDFEDDLDQNGFTEPFQQGERPVSYTHLDVYKRQTGRMVVSTGL